MANRKKFFDYEHNRMNDLMFLHRNGLKKDTCEMCGTSIDLHIHHIIPYKWGGDSKEMSNIVTVCQKHHMELHRRFRDKLDFNLLHEYLEPYKEEIRKLVKSTLPKELKGKL